MALLLLTKYLLLFRKFPTVEKTATKRKKEEIRQIQKVAMENRYKGEKKEREKIFQFLKEQRIKEIERRRKEELENLDSDDLAERKKRKRKRKRENANELKTVIGERKDIKNKIDETFDESEPEDFCFGVPMFKGTRQDESSDGECDTDSSEDETAVKKINLEFSDESDNEPPMNIKIVKNDVIQNQQTSDDNDAPIELKVDKSSEQIIKDKDDGIPPMDTKTDKIQNQQLLSDKNDAPIQMNIEKSSEEQSAIGHDKPESSDKDLKSELKPKRLKTYPKFEKIQLPERFLGERQLLSKVHSIPKGEPTLLEKLFVKEIRDERTEILQCVKYICDNNFFDNQ